MTARTPVQTRSRANNNNNNNNQQIVEPRNFRADSDSSSDRFVMSVEDPNDAFSFELDNLRSKITRLRRVNDA